MSAQSRNAQTTRRIAATLGGLAIILAATAWWLKPWHPAPTDRAASPGAIARPAVPVIIYLIDTLRADRLGLHGYSRRPTSPRMDALAAESVVFDQAYGAAPWTLPSVASLITSTFACEHGITTYGRTLNPAVPTLAETLADAGYFTAAYFSNIHAGPLADLSRGYRVAEERLITVNDRTADVESLLRDHAGGPFLLYLHTMEPHGPFATPSGVISRFGHVSVEDRETFRAIWKQFNELRSADWSAGRAPGTTDNTSQQSEMMRFLNDRRADYELLYDAAVLHADDNLGRTVDVLKRTGVWERALFILVSDHGEEFGEHGGWLHGQSVYEEQARVPLLVHFPGGEFAGRRIGRHVSLVDVMPTILDYLGHADLCVECRGSSLLPLIGKTLSGAAPAATDSWQEPPVADVVPAIRMNELQFYRPAHERRGNVNVVLRRAHWKGIWNAQPGTMELFDLARDPGERSDVSATNAKLAGEMRRQAADWLTDCQSEPRAPQGVDGLDDRTREKLRSLGYIK